MQQLPSLYEPEGQSTNDDQSLAKHRQKIKVDFPATYSGMMQNEPNPFNGGQLNPRGMSHLRPGPGEQHGPYDHQRHANSSLTRLSWVPCSLH